MDLLIILTYVAFAWAMFKIFKIPVNKWTIPTAALGGIFIVSGLILLMNYNHPYTFKAQKAVISIPVVPQVTGVVIEVTDKKNTLIKKGEVLFRLDPTRYQARVDRLMADIGKKEGADVLTGGRRKLLEGELKDGYYLEPTILFGQNNMRVFQEEIFGPVLAVTTFKTMEEALELANDTQYGLGAGVWSRNGNLAYKMGRGIQAGRVWTNCYHAYPAHAAFGGYKQSGIGRETHKMMLEHYQQTKCLLVSYSDKPLGLF